MQATDRQVIEQLCLWLQQGTSCWLATVIETWGSSPRPVGSLLCCNAEGRLVGSLSGGCVEDDLLERLTRGELASTSAEYFKYGISTDETERLGLPCGGHLHIVVEPVHPGSLPQFQEILEALKQRRCLERSLTLNQLTQAFKLRAVERFANLEFNGKTQELIQTFGPRHQLFIIGAGMVSSYLAGMAQALNYLVTVCDPRQQLIDDFDQEGVTLVCDMPDDAIRRLADDEATAIVALTHDPRIDDMGLMQALKTRAFYVGAMGSRKTSESRRERLLQLNVSQTEIDTLHAPIGLPIGSKTPPEIAISILAEITAVRANKRKECIVSLHSTEQAHSN